MFWKQRLRRKLGEQGRVEGLVDLFLVVVMGMMMDPLLQGLVGSLMIIIR